jgi:O-antigen ligase
MSFQPELRRAATWSAIALGFAIPISTATSNILLALTILLFAMSGAYREKWQVIARNPLAIAALWLCALTLLGCAWGGGAWPEKKHYLVKYLALLVIPLLVPLFASSANRVHALQAFVAAMLLTLLISCLSWLNLLGWLPDAVASRFDANQTVDMMGARNAVVFKLSITHSFLMAIAAYLLAQAARLTKPTRLRWLLAGLAILAAANVLVMVVGRTGYVVLAVLGMCFFIRRYGRRGALLAAIICVLVGAATFHWSAAFHARTSAAIEEATHWQEGKGDPSSIGARLDFYNNTLKIIREHPLIGVGTGGFAIAYSEKIKNTEMVESNNPHNQYLLFTAQYGILGLAALLSFYVLYWRLAGKLAPPWQEIARAVLLVYAVGNLFNSFMLDYSERMLFAWLSGILFAGLADQARHENG